MGRAISFVRDIVCLGVCLSPVLVVSGDKNGSENRIVWKTEMDTKSGLGSVEMSRRNGLEWKS